MNQGYVKERLVLFLKKFIGRNQDLVDKYSVSTSQIIHDDLDLKILRTDVVYHLNNVFYCSFICICSINNITFSVGWFYVIIDVARAIGTYTSRQCVCIVFHFLVVCFVYATFCVSLVLIT